jgi:SAM-dependent methyltransferase
MTDFQFDQPFDAAFNAINTFRHLETEAAALSHLKCVAKHLRPGGVFVLSLHIVPHDGELWGTERWSVKTPEFSIRYALSVEQVDEAKRVETLKMTMKVQIDGQEEKKLTDHLRLRLYDVEQLKSLLSKVKGLELIRTYDFWFDINDPCRLSKKSCDVVLVLQKKA